MAGRRPGGGLESLPNIGHVVAEKLRAAGISSAEELKRIGSVEAALRLAQGCPDDPPCRSMVSGLEGAIRGVRWHVIPSDERERIWAAYRRQLTAAGGG